MSSELVQLLACFADANKLYKTLTRVKMKKVSPVAKMIPTLMLECCRQEALISITSYMTLELCFVITPDSRYQTIISFSLVTFKIKLIRLSVL